MAHKEQYKSSSISPVPSCTWPFFLRKPNIITQTAWRTDLNSLFQHKHNVSHMDSIAYCPALSPLIRNNPTTRDIPFQRPTGLIHKPTLNRKLYRKHTSMAESSRRLANNDSRLHPHPHALRRPDDHERRLASIPRAGISPRARRRN